MGAQARALPGPYVLFGLRRPLPAGAVVAQGGPTNGRDRQTLPARPLPAAAWLFWLDEVPDAEFQHASRLLLVDDRSGRVVRNERYAWWPTIDARRRAFLATRDAYWSARYRVRATDVQRVPSAWAAQADLPAGATQFTGDCIVTIGDRTDPMFQANFAAINLFATTHGIRKLDATSLADLGPKIDQLHNGRPPCLDVVVWISGHGSAASDTPLATVAIANRVTIKGRRGRPSRVEVRSERITSADVRRVLAAHPDMTFNLVVGSCLVGVERRRPRRRTRSTARRAPTRSRPAS